MSGIVLLAGLLLAGIIARSNLIAAAAGILLIIKLTGLNFMFPLLERRGLELGLLFLLLSILVPLATNRISEKDIIYNLTSWAGIMAITGGALATHLNGQGLKLLQFDPIIIFGLITGSILGIIFLGGIPVGPLMAAGLTALFLEISRLFKH
jgi:uncharacterized membrane protein (DUF441 family)